MPSARHVMQPWPPPPSTQLSGWYVVCVVCGGSLGRALKLLARCQQGGREAVAQHLLADHLQLAAEPVVHTNFITPLRFGGDEADDAQPVHSMQAGRLSFDDRGMLARALQDAARAEAAWLFRLLPQHLVPDDVRYTVAEVALTKPWGAKFLPLVTWKLPPLVWRQMQGPSKLHTAASQGDLAACTALLRMCPDHMRGQAGCDALRVAAVSGRWEAIPDLAHLLAPEVGSLEFRSMGVRDVVERHGLLTCAQRLLAPLAAVLQPASRPLMVGYALGEAASDATGDEGGVAAALALVPAALRPGVQRGASQQATARGQAQLAGWISSYTG